MQIKKQKTSEEIIKHKHCKPNCPTHGSFPSSLRKYPKNISAHALGHSKFNKIVPQSHRFSSFNHNLSTEPKIDKFKPQQQHLSPKQKTRYMNNSNSYKSNQKQMILKTQHYDDFKKWREVEHRKLINNYLMKLPIKNCKNFDKKQESTKRSQMDSDENDAVKTIGHNRNYPTVITSSTRKIKPFQFIQSERQEYKEPEIEDLIIRKGKQKKSWENKFQKIKNSQINQQEKNSEKKEWVKIEKQESRKMQDQIQEMHKNVNRIEELVSKFKRNNVSSQGIYTSFNKQQITGASQAGTSYYIENSFPYQQLNHIKSGPYCDLERRKDEQKINEMLKSDKKKGDGLNYHSYRYQQHRNKTMGGRKQKAPEEDSEKCIHRKTYNFH